MNGKYLLDTNIVIALFADDKAVKDNLAKADEVFVPSIVIGELCFGAWKSARAKENLERIDEFVASSIVLGCDADRTPIRGNQKCVTGKRTSNTRK